MLPDLDWLTRLAAALLATGLLVLFLVRAIRKDRREYARFRRYRSTVRRQAMLRRWLIESLALFGGTAALVLLAVHPFVAPLLAETQALPPVAWLRDALTGGLGAGLLLGAVVGGTLLTVLGVRSARAEGGVIMVGDIASLLPRNRPELGWGAALSVNAGIVEEALFRLALPALLVIVTGEPLSAFVLAALVFGALHAYQGWLGVVATSVVGLLFTTLYVVSGSILLAMLVHVLFDLRTLVVIPMAVYRVHKVPGSVRFPRPLALAAQPEADA
ncbi:CPBP family intramembrane glutamic endopeptidase [Chryseoglobus sp. 28M-23]|uniref:CPBP family intramembrane glutamic endopeptidase n=1 Tax=Chryseoglobus sp. 28M-23 TaxID=2772253 RepID=UPI0017479290|nr:CPBP family intramembrane glutamic endopeptidase [Chryseoglobus sp. 28M-23]QOD94171.1 CPBP family intramembrane metalloprotease [Chryseoglobus sp. 28M-23]